MTVASSGQLRRRTAGLPRVVGRRLLLLLPITLVVTLGVFALAAISPLDPLDAYLSGQSASLTDQQRAQLRQHLGLDRSWYAAWWNWLAHALTGDLGQSLAYRQSVAQVVGSRLPWTLVLSAAGLILALVISVASGVWAALHPGSAADRAISTLANLLQAVPPFVIGMGTIGVFALGLRLFPTGGLTDPGGQVTFESLVRHLVLPTVVFALSQVSWLILGLRETLIATLRDDPVRFARLRGLPRRVIVLRHVLPTAAPPFIALVAARLPELIAGSVIVETVFAWPGIGSAMVQAAQRLDLSLLCFLTVATTAAVLLCTLLADVLYVILDPRVENDV